MAARVAQVLGEPRRPASQLREILRAQIGCTLHELGREATAPPRSVHGARKQLKKARATLRLLRPSIGKEVYRTENIAVRDAARPLSGVRDSEVLLATFEKLLTRLASEGISPNLEPLRASLEAQVQELAHEHNVDVGGRESIKLALTCVLRRTSRWTLQRDDWRHVRRGLARTYRSGRSELKAARSAPSTEHLHDWRKQTKYLWHQLQMLCPIAPGKLGILADQLHRLADYLGDEHDLAILEQTVDKLDIELTGRNRMALKRAIEQRRRQLRAKAFALGEHLYEASTRRFTERMDELWNTWGNSGAARPKNLDRVAQRAI